MGKTTLAYFDLYTLLFASVLGTEYYPGASFDSTKTSIRFGGGLGLGVRFYLTKNISFRIEGRQNFFMRTSTNDGGQGGIQKPLELSLGIGWLF
jgi:opacity protein-like surface antigen